MRVAGSHSGLHRRRNRHTGRGPRSRSPQRRHPRPARHERPRPPPRRPRRTRRVPADRLERLTRPNAEQRIHRLLALPGQPGLHYAARELGIRHATLASQIRQLEAVTGTTLLHTGPDGTI